MRKFIINLFIISSLFSLVLLAVPYATIPPNMATGYDNGFNVFPLDSISVDILFVGPSTLSFGLHQETLLESGFDFFSFGLHAGTGPLYVLNETKRIGRDARITIMSPGYPWIFNPQEGDLVPKLLSHSRQTFPEVLSNYGLRNFILSKAWALAHHLRPWHSYYNPSKVRDGFRWSSDIISRRGVIRTQCKPTNQWKTTSGKNLERIEKRFADFEKAYDLESAIDFSFWRQHKDQYTQLLPTPMRASDLADQYVDVMDSLALELSLPLLLAPESCIFPDSLFCDRFHLNLEGSIIYSEMIAHAINDSPSVD